MGNGCIYQIDHLNLSFYFFYFSHKFSITTTKRYGSHSLFDYMIFIYLFTHVDPNFKPLYCLFYCQVRQFSISKEPHKSPFSSSRCKIITNCYIARLYDVYNVLKFIWFWIRKRSCQLSRLIFTYLVPSNISPFFNK